MTPPIVAVVRRFPLSASRHLRVVGVHVLAGLVAALIASSLEGLTRHFLPWYEARSTVAGEVRTAVAQFYPFDFLLYFMVAGLAGAVLYARQLRERELRAAQLETQLTQAHLDVLALQLQPHFLFNTLHAIAGMVSEDPARASRMIARLGELLRYSMRRSRRQFVPLAEELDFLEHYVAIQEARFDERLRVVFDIEAAAADAEIPPLLLQPLVENAIQHGVGARSTPGTITISASRDNGTLHLAVRDDGPGLPLDGGRLPREGIGLANTRARLTQLYADRCRFEWSNGAEGGAELRISLPFRAASVAP
jgi:LytS/YehU family sensor histidine kinase